MPRKTRSWSSCRALCRCVNSSRLLPPPSHSPLVTNSIPFPNTAHDYQSAAPLASSCLLARWSAHSPASRKPEAAIQRHPLSLGGIRAQRCSRYTKRNILSLDAENITAQPNLSPADNTDVYIWTRIPSDYSTNDSPLFLPTYCLPHRHRRHWFCT